MYDNRLIYEGRSSRKTVVSIMLSLLTLSLLLLSSFFFSPVAAYSSAWEDEEVEDDETPAEGMAKYDNTAETVAHAVGDHVSVESITSPDLFNNFESDFQVQWDVQVEPTSSDEPHERTYLSLTYDIGFDAYITVERCSEPYAQLPNSGINEDGSISSQNDCEGDSQSWERIELEASQYIDGASTTVEFGDFLLQNSAYLRLTVGTNSGSIASSGDNSHISLAVDANFDDETVSAGNDGYENVVSDGEPEETSGGEPADDTPSDEGNANDEATTQPEPTESETGSVEDDETGVPEDDGVESDETEQPRDEDIVIEEDRSWVDELLDRPWIFAIIGIVATVAFFLLRRSKKDYGDDDDIESEYLDEDDDDEVDDDNNDDDENSIYI